MAKHKYIETPERLEELFGEYLEWAKQNHYTEQQWVGKDGNEVAKKIMKHISFDGFEGWLCENNVITDLGDYSSNKDDRYAQYATIIARIRKICRGRLLTAAMSNVANGNVVSRYLGLKESTDNTHVIKDYDVSLDLS